MEIEDISNSCLEHVINEYIHSERDRSLMRRRLIDGRTYEQLANEFDMSVRQIENLIHKYNKLVHVHCMIKIP